MATKTKVLSLVLTLIMVLFCFSAVACNNGKNPPDETPNEPTKTSWPEAGVYYFDDVNYENTLTLNVGDTFSLYVKGALHSGKYTLTDSSLELDFNAEGKENATATYEGNVISLTFDGVSMRFLKKLSYTVSFNVNGGSAVASQTVLNGKSATKPADPTRDGYAFVGWYTDANFTAPYAFGATPVTADTTVFARWSAETASGMEYTVKLDANYDGAAALDSVLTVGGKLFDLPTLVRDGYTFSGWWFSTELDGNKLSNKYEEGMLVNANTTLYALWQQNATGSKLVAPIVNVLSGSISWNSVDGARSYDVKVIGPDGQALIDATTGSTTMNVPFSTYAAGKYEIRVTALANTGADNNAETVRYYVNKGLEKVSVFSVIEPSTLVFNTVENAEKYLITVVCGNPEHNHTMFDNGSSRTFNFANCTMTGSGIHFTVTAVAEGYASSTSAVFTYTRTLDKVSGFRFDAATETLVWNEVASAESYMVSVKCGNAAHNHDFVNFGSQTFVSLKECAPVDGGIVVKVYPKTEGYISPVASEYVYNKAVLETPSNLLLDGTVLSWNAVTGAEKYVVTVNSTEYETTTASFDLAAAIDVVEGVDYSITVRALGATASLATDTLVARYYDMNDKVSYAGGKLTWTPVIGADYYELQVNDGDVVVVDGGVFCAPVTLTKSGENVVKVRFVDGKTVSEWATTTVMAHRVTFDTLGGNFVADQFKAVGDPMELVAAEKPGYTFVAWYNVPGGATNNGAAYTDEFFGESGSIVLYAYYKAMTYEVTYNYGVGGSADATTGVVTYDGHYQLVVPTASDVAGAFGGWFSAPYGLGVQYTDESGKSLEPWAHLEGKELYAFWVDEALSFTRTKVNGRDAYAVSKGTRIALVTEVTIPATYRGLPVAFITGNGFADCTNLTVINLPETIEQISIISPFAGCTSLEAINVYDVDGVADPAFASEDGVLLSVGANSNKLALVPMAKTGTFRIPAGVTEIPEASFANSSISKVIITPEVTVIGREAFKDATKLNSVIFEVATDGSSKNLTIGTRAFMNCTSLSKITLPARLTDIKLQRYALDGTTVDVASAENAFAGCTALTAINVASNNQNYKSIDNVLFSKDGRTLLLAPVTLSGTYVVPATTRNIAAGAFVGCDYLTEVVVSSNVVVIGDCAFYDLERLETVTFKGTSFEALGVGKYAFRNCDDLENVVLETGSRVATLGEGAFMACTSLEEFTVPATMTKVGASVFADCTSLETISFAEDGKELEFGANAFQNCISLTVVNLPANVSKIPGVFAGCTSLTEVNIDPASTFFTSVEGVVYDINKTEIIFFPTGKTGEYTTPDTLTTINNGVFQNVTKLDKMTISNTVTYIGENAFNGVDIPVVEFVGEATGSLVIGDSAFSGATLGDITLPAHTVSIGNNAFYEATLGTFSINEGVGSIGDYAFYGASATLTVPASVKTIGVYSFSSSYVTVTLTVENSQLETIGDSAFRSNKKLTSLTIPASVKSIGNYAFYSAYNISSVTFDGTSQLETIGAYAFAQTEFSSITIPASVKSIGAYAFYYSELSSVVFEDGENDLVLGHTYVDVHYNEAMGTTYYDVYRGYVFADCYSLESVELPYRLTTLEQSTFEFAGYYADELTVTISDEGESRLTTIGDRCFYAAPLTTFTVPKSVSNLPPVTDPVSGETYNRLGIGTLAFRGTDLTSITFEDGGTLPLTIGENAFEYVDTLESITLPARLSTYTTYTGDVLDPLANGAMVFKYCDGLTSVLVEDADNAYYQSLNGVLATADGKEIVFCPVSLTGSFTVPATVTKIHAYAFQDSQLTEIIFEQGAEDMYIDECAFIRANGLTSLVLSDNVVSLGDKVFYECSNLQSLTLGKGLLDFDFYMIYGCNKLAEINVGADGQGTYFSSANGILYNADKSALVSYPRAKTDTEVVVDANVKVIYEGAFANNTKLQKVVLPEGLIEIQKQAFYQCSGLQVVNIPSTVQLVAKEAFRYCSALNSLTFDQGSDDFLILEDYAFANTAALKAVALPARLYNLGNNAFYSSGLNTVTFGEGSALVAIGGYAFAETGVYELAIPAGVVTIGEYAFYRCASLLEITFEEGLVSIGDHALAGCDELRSVSFPASLKTLGNSVFYYRYSSSSKYTCAKLESVTFAPGTQIEVIPAGTFAYTGIKTITIPASVRVIEGSESGDYASESKPSAFSDATSLESVYFENGSRCVEIGNAAFDGCEALKVFEMPATVTTIGNYAFYYCRALESIVIYENTVDLGSGAFWGCNSLASVDLRTKATALPSSMFNDCYALTEITIPASVSSIGTGCFSGTGLASVNVDPRNTFFKAIDGILYTADGTGIVMVPPAKNIGDFVVPNTVTTIGQKLFYECDTITSVTFEGGRTEHITIERQAFSRCSNLNKVIFTEMVASIGEDAFYNCSSLTYVEIASDMDEDMFGWDCFASCSILEVKNLSDMELVAGDYYQCEGLVRNAIRIFTEGESSISTIGDFIVMDVDGEIWLLSYTGNDTDITIPEGIHVINDAAFYGTGVVNVVLPSTLKEIGAQAFYECDLEQILLNEGLEVIGDEAFYYCGSLEEIVIPSSIKYIGEEAFYRSGLKKVVLPDTMTEIGSYAFYYATELSDVQLPATLKVIGSYAFSGTAIEHIDLPEGLEEIGAYAFKSSDLLEITFPASLHTIGTQAFAETNISGAMMIPETVVTLGAKVFYNLSGGTMTLMVAASEKPSGWSDDWYMYYSSYYNGDTYNTVLWGFTGEDITYKFETNGGSVVEDIVSGTPITLPAAPTRDGYVFMGWYDNAEFTGSALTGSYYNGTKTTLYAKWFTEEQFNATFIGTKAEYAVDATNGASHTIVDENSKGRVYVYFAVNATEDLTLTITTVSGADTALYIYDDASDANSLNYDYIKYKDGYGNDEVLTYTFNAGTTYYIVAYAYYESFVGEFTVNITVG